MEVTSAGIWSSIACALLVGGCFSEPPKVAKEQAPLPMEDDEGEVESSSSGGESSSLESGSFSSEGSSSSSSSTGELALCWNGATCNPEPPGDATEIECWCMCDLPGEPVEVGPCFEGEECVPVPVSEKWESLYGDVGYCVPG